MNEVFSQQAEQHADEPIQSQTEAKQKSKRSKRRFRLGLAPLICSAFLTLMLLGGCLNTAVSGGISDLPFAYSQAVRKHAQAIVQAQQIVVVPATPTLLCPAVLYTKTSYFKAPCHK